jgi:hypothetical protein
VKRYDHSEKDDCRGMVSNDEDGDWVRWEDAAALEKRLAEATALLKTVPLPDPDDEGPTLGDIDTAFYVIATLKRRLSATPSPPAEPAPSLVEQVDRRLLALMEGIELNEPDLADVLLDLVELRKMIGAAREAGGR